MPGSPKDKFSSPFKVGNLTVYGSPYAYDDAKTLPAQTGSSYISPSELLNQLSDADTYYSGGIGNRFALLDAPEKDQEWGDFAIGEAKDILHSIPSGTKLKVVQYGKDKLGKRDLVEVYMPDGETLSHKLLKRGVAMGTRNTDTRSKQILDQAIAGKVGMFNPNHPLTQNFLRTPYVHRQINSGVNFGLVPDEIDASRGTQKEYVSAKRKAFQGYKDRSYAGSIEDAFMAKGLDPSYSFREKSFRNLGYKDYKGTERQNTVLLNAINRGEISKDQLLDTVYNDKKEAPVRTGTIQDMAPLRKNGGIVSRYQVGGKMVQINGETGEHESTLDGGERIMSRKDTRAIIVLAQVCQSMQDFVKLGKLVYDVLKTQDKRKPEYVME